MADEEGGAPQDFSLNRDSHMQIRLIPADVNTSGY